MRLSYLVDHWPGLFEAYLFREMQWMRQRGHSVTVMSLGCGGPHGFRSETKDYVNLAEFGLDDIPVLQLDSRQMTSEEVVGRSLSFAQLHRTELIDAHLARIPAEVACDIHRAGGPPYSVRMRGGDVHSNTSLRLDEILDHASAVCPMSQFLADVLVGRTILKKVPPGIPAKVDAGKLHVVPNSLPGKYLASEPVAQSDATQVIGALGRTVPIKRFQDLIEAVAGLIADFPGVKLMIIGGGAMMPELQKLAVEASIADRFTITGFQSWIEVMTLVRQFHIYVQCSELEGCSLANIEAGFQGIPLVLSRTGSNEQTVEQGVNGYLFSPGDVTALRESLKALLLAGARKREQMGSASLEIVGSKFSAENILPRLEVIFHDAICDRNRPREMCLFPIDAWLLEVIS
jgi:glycosyltransferase involved in cell wall biosynthesis